MKEPRTFSLAQNRRLFLTGTVLFVLYYLADCTLDSLVFGEESLHRQLFSPTLHEVTIRALSGSFLFTLFIVSSVLLSKNRVLQQSLVGKSREILSKNRELQTYHYALSHELRTSLTRIVTASEILSQHCGTCSVRHGSQLIAHILRGSEKMSRQIDDMLDFSEVSRIELQRKRIALHEIVREIARDMTGKSEGAILDFQIDGNIEADGDPDLIRVALKSLMDNAVKFRDPQRPGEVCVGVEKRRGVPIYFIRDNGIGFDPDQAERLYRPFERLPQAHHLAGNGVGLAVARTIIERHGGRIWAESTPGKGSTFYFTLGTPPGTADCDDVTKPLVLDGQRH